MFDSDSSGQHLSKLIVSIFRLNGRIIEWGDLLGAPLGLTSARWQILGAIELAEVPLTAPQISRAMGITRQGAQKQLNFMMQKALVVQKPNPEHGRSYRYDLTEQGRTIYHQIQAIYTARLEEVMFGISPQDLAVTQKILHSMMLNIEAQVMRKNGKTLLRPPNEEKFI